MFQGSSLARLAALQVRGAKRRCSPRDVYSSSNTGDHSSDTSTDHPGSKSRIVSPSPSLKIITAAFFVASDLNLYYDVHHPQWYKRPDWFAAVGVSRLYKQQDLRLSYVIWQEGVSPFVAVELLSPGTEKDDLGQTLREVSQPPTKWEVYERVLRIPYYVVFDRYTDELRAFQLVADQYSELVLHQAKLRRNQAKT